MTIPLYPMCVLNLLTYRYVTEDSEDEYRRAFAFIDSYTRK